MHWPNRQTWKHQKPSTHPVKCELSDCFCLCFKDDVIWRWNCVCMFVWFYDWANSVSATRCDRGQFVRWFNESKQKYSLRPQMNWIPNWMDPWTDLWLLEQSYEKQHISHYMYSFLRLVWTVKLSGKRALRRAFFNCSYFFWMRLLARRWLTDLVF